MGFAGRAATSGGGRALLVDHRTAPENPPLDTNTTGDDLANRLAGHRILGQRLIIHALRYFEAPWLVARFARNGFVGISRHRSSSALQWRRPVGRASPKGLIMAEIWSTILCTRLQSDAP